MTQMQRTLVMLGGLLVVAGGVALFAWKGVYEKDEQAARKKSAEERLFATDAPDGRKDAGAATVEFRRVVVTTKDETTVLERAPGEPWKITAPVHSKVDLLVVDGLLSQLQTARFKTTLDGEATDADLKTYGLDHPGFTVEAEAEIDGQQRTTKLEGGIENPFDGTFYMRKNGTRTVHMAEGGVRWSLAKTTFDLRDKEVFAIDDAKLEKFALKSKVNDWEIVRGDDKLWRLTRPEATLADTVTVNSVLGGIRGERATAFPGEPTDERLASLGFGAPLATATLTLSTGPVTFKLAVPNADAGETIYALREDANGKVLAQVGSSARAAFDRNAFELRDKSLIPFAKQTVTKIVIAVPGAPEVIVERDSADAGLESWRVTAPRSGQARAYKVATLLWTLSAIKAGSLVVEKPDQKVLETYSLDAKHARVVKLFSGATELATLLLGKELIGKSGSSYAVGARKAIVEIDSSRFNELPWAVDDLLDVPTADAGR